MAQTGDTFRLGATGLFPLESTHQNVRNAGNRAFVQPGEEKTLLSISGDDDKSMALTITLEHLLRETGTPTPPATAIIRWGTGGFRSQAEVDFINGTTLSVFCASLSVIGRNDADPGAETLDPTDLGAFVGYMPFGGRQAQRTLPGGTVPEQGGFAPVQTIPAWARVLHVQSAPLLAATDFVEWRDAAGILISQDAVLPSHPIRIPNNARFVVFSSADAVKVATFIYELAL